MTVRGEGFRAEGGYNLLAALLTIGLLKGEAVYRVTIKKKPLQAARAEKRGEGDRLPDPGNKGSSGR